KVMASTALVLNIAVSVVAFLGYLRAGHFRPKLLVPFLLTSIPTAFLGGTLRVSDQVYFVLLYAILTCVALRMIFFPVLSEKTDRALRPVPLVAALGSGAVIGLLSGIVGIGGGIFLAPLIVLTGWGTSKQAAASAGAFIALNSLSGVAGRLAVGTFSFGESGFLLLVVGLLGALIGSHLGANRFSNATVRRILGFILLFAVSVYWLSLSPV
ncbi:MAG: sulfite exporter TauE/SafE family protein, partial [Anaerolineales bacterium]|nr:sulfite exporter TauE/SafE family protein [Anaerolineales bacterium]